MLPSTTTAPAITASAANSRYVFGRALSPLDQMVLTLAPRRTAILSIRATMSAMFRAKVLENLMKSLK